MSKLLELGIFLIVMTGIITLVVGVGSPDPPTELVISEYKYDVSSCMRFVDGPALAEQKEVGRICWDNGEVTFEGNIEESAKLFFEYYSSLCNCRFEE